MKILVTDDSVVYRSQIKAALSGVAFINEIDTANNGKIAIDKLNRSLFDLVILDLEMPEMDGIEALKAIKQKGYKTRVIMFSSQSKSGSEKTLEALSLGADDFIPKPVGDHHTINNLSDTIKNILLPKLRQFIVGSPTLTREETKSPLPVTKDDAPYVYRTKHPIRDYLRKEISLFIPKVVVIGSSTGGPPALDRVFKSLGTVPRCPVLIAQHMPPVFTASLAKRISQMSGMECSEAKNMETLQNKIYVAPGDFHMSLAKLGDTVKIQIDQRPERNCIRPAADYLFESAAKIFQSAALGIVLTGMGEDACDGAIAIKEAGGGVIIQTKESCTVFGMPGAVFEAKAYDEMMDPEQINMYLKRKLM